MLTVRDLLSTRSVRPGLAVVEGASGRGVTWRQVAELADSWVSNGLVGPVGLAISDPVVMASNFVAGLASGVIVVPLDPAAPERDLKSRVDQLGVRCILTDRNAEAISGSAVWSLETWWASSDGIHKLGGRRRPQVDLPPVPAWPSLLMASSGTTGDPKIVPLTEKQLLATAAGVAAQLALSPEDVGYSPLPLFHINGLVVGVLSALVADSTIVVERQFSRRSFWSTVGRVGATWLNLVPAVMAILASRAEIPSGASWSETVRSPVSSQTVMVSDSSRTGRLRLARSASAPLPAAVRERFELLTSIPVVETYGMTEAASQITANPPGAVRPGSVGLPVGVELRVVGEGSEPVTGSQAGKVQIRGSRVTPVYWAMRPSREDRHGWGDAEEVRRGVRGAETTSGLGLMRWTSRSAVDADGWLDTGDVGYQDEDGYVYLVGRDGDVINRGGEKIAPREVEELLLAHPDVTAAVVVGRPHPTVGAEPVAYVIAASSASVSPEDLAAELAQTCEDSLSRFKRPVEIHVTSSLPAGPTGKIRRAEVASRVAAGLDPSSGRRRCSAATKVPTSVASAVLGLPQRSAKPRRRGLTMVIDGGLPVCSFADAVSSAAGHIDLVKFGWGTALVTPGIEAKMQVLRDLGIGAFFGGTLFEKFVAADRFDAYLALCHRLEVSHVEVSDGTIEISRTDRARYIRRVAREFTVISEVGYKDQARAAASQAADLGRQASEDLQSGAKLVIAEARESGRSGICRSDGTPREDIVDAVLACDPQGEHVMFEAPTKDLQVRFIEMSGPDVNLGNIAPGDVIGLETLRLGLRSDTFGTFSKENVHA